jgi:hypothetical protein
VDIPICWADGAGGGGAIRRRHVALDVVAVQRTQFHGNKVGAQARAEYHVEGSERWAQNLSEMCEVRPEDAARSRVGEELCGNEAEICC